jgi:hypothetical protein
MKRDCDLIAVPWIANARPVADLIAAICAAINAREVGEIEQKPQGRVAITLQVDGWVKPIDLSIFAAPPAGDERPGAYYDKEGNLLGTYTRKRKHPAGDER